MPESKKDEKKDVRKCLNPRCDGEVNWEEETKTCPKCGLDNESVERSLDLEDARTEARRRRDENKKKSDKPAKKGWGF